MRLGKFITADTESILLEWDAFAFSIWPDSIESPTEKLVAVRDHAREILTSIAKDMVTPEKKDDRKNKSQGEKVPSSQSHDVESASKSHGIERLNSGFSLLELFAEYRALRASVVRLWEESGHRPDLQDINDLARFNESLDQSLSESICTYTNHVNEERDFRINNENVARKEAEIAQARLEKTLVDLNSSHWHLKKIQEALPICVKCGKVKSNEGWEDVLKYLKSNAPFLTHAYCPNCLDETMGRYDDEEKNDILKTK